MDPFNLNEFLGYQDFYNNRYAVNDLQDNSVAYNASTYSYVNDLIFGQPDAASVNVAIYQQANSVPAFLASPGY